MNRAFLWTDDERPSQPIPATAIVALVLLFAVVFLVTLVRLDAADRPTHTGICGSGACMTKGGGL